MFKGFGKIFDDLLLKFLFGINDLLDNRGTYDQLDKTKHFQAAEEIKKIYREHNLPEPKIYLTDVFQRGKVFSEDLPNAGTTPFGYYVFVSEGFLKLNSEVGEKFKQKYGKSLLEHVFAHEIGHLKAPQTDPLLGDFLKAVGCLILVKFRPFKNLFNDQNKLVNFTSELVASALALNYTNIPANLIKQQREFEADMVAAELTSPEGFAETLRTLQEKVDSIADTTPETPKTFYKSVKETIEDILKPIQSHPDTDERIKRLEMIAQDNKRDCSSSLA